MSLLLAALLADPLADFRVERAAATAPPAELAAADATATDAAAAAKAGDADTSRRLARDARWLLPAPPAGLPPHVRRTFGAARLRHADRVTALAYFPDGSRVASSSVDGTARVWNLLNGREVVAYRGHPAPASALNAAAVAVHPSGKLVASAGGPDIHLWDAATGERTRVLSGGHAEAVRGLAFTPDGATLAAADDGGRLLLWDVAAGKPRHAFPDQRKRLEGVALTGKLLATVNVLGEVVLYDATQPGQGPVYTVAREEAGGLPLYGVAVTDTAVLVGGKNKLARVYSPTGSPVRVLEGHAEAVLAVAADPGGKLFATAGEDGTVRAWEPATGKPLRVFQGHPGAVTALAVRPDGKEIVSGGADGRLRVWPLADADIHRTLPLSAPGFAVAYGPTGRVAVGGLDGSLKVFDPATGRVVEELTGHPHGVAVACRAGDRLATGGGDKLIRLWDVEAGTATELKGHTSTVLALAATGDQLYSGSADGTVRAWELPAGKPVWTWANKSAVCGLAVLAGNRLAVGTADGGLTLLDVAGEPKPLGDTTAHTRGTLAVAARPDGGLIATGGGDGVVRLWRPAAGGPLPVGRIDPPARTGQPTAVLGLAFGPDGRLLAIAGGDQVRVWDTAAGAERQALRGHTDTATAVAFSPDGGTVLSVGADKTARAFPLTRGGGRPPAHAGPVNAVALSPDGQTLATGSDDHTVKLWDTQAGAERAVLVGPTDAVGAVGFAATGEVVVASAEGRVRWYSPAGAELRGRPTHRTFAMSVAADGTALAAWSVKDKEAAGFDVLPPGGEPRRVAGVGAATCAAVSAVARLAVAGGPDGSVRLWDLATGERAVGGDWKLGDAPLADVSLTPDGKTLVALDDTGTVTVAAVGGRAVRATVKLPGAGGVTAGADRFATYSPDGLVVAFGLDGKELRRWPLPGPVQAAAFAADGKTLAVGNADGTAYLLELP